MSGFQHASVTKGLMMILGISSLAVSLMEIKPYFHLQVVPHMTKYHQFWRILVHPFVFTNSTELLMGELLLYNVGVKIERSFGPRKYSAFVLISSVVSNIFSLAGIILLGPFGVNAIPAGPYGVIFSLLWQYYRTVPSLYEFKVFGIEMSSRIFIWLYASQLVLSHPPLSVLAAASGLMTGYLYRTDTLLLPSLRHRRILRPLKSYRIPLSIYNLLARLFQPISNSAPPRRSHRVLPGQISDATREANVQRATLSSILAGRIGASTATPRRTAAAAASPATDRPTGTVRDTAVDTETTPPSGARAARAAMGEWVSEMAGRAAGGARAPSEEEIATLTSMFPNLSRDVVINALQRNNHNTAQAVEALLQEVS
ncbi:hypothetical protein DB88DRAFT_509787 [Papiliotrema laurentii]|uniref:CUE domain-containing protein n=1 Tax=Papiliotrema laurentii TaxID=5418 RepID=A0AAD9L646_PAPLA|nr:hypothetical protein DB88DRAFT_509787 [Papiliotrema laurentii]